jgi:hypothetical protein
MSHIEVVLLIAAYFSLSTKMINFTLALRGLIVVLSQYT